MTPSPVKQLAGERRIPCLQPGRIKRELDSFLQAAAAHGPYDIGVVIAFGQILPRAVLDLPAGGCVNVHASLLPRWRGAAPIQQAILAGDQRTGVALMRMEEGLDTGPVYVAAEIPIGQSDDAGTLHDSLAALGADLLARNLPAIAAGEIVPAAQPAEGATYAAKIGNDDCLMRWDDDAAANSRRVRALSPAPGAFTRLNGRRLKIFRAAPKPLRAGLAAVSPGEVYFAGGSELEVQCGEGILALQELQLEGKRRMETGEFLRGVQLSRGDRLGA